MSDGLSLRGASSPATSIMSAECRLHENNLLLVGCLCIGEEMDAKRVRRWKRVETGCVKSDWKPEARASE